MTQQIVLEVNTLTEHEQRLLAWVKRNANGARRTPWLGVVQWVPQGNGGILLFYDAAPAGKVKDAG